MKIQILLSYAIFVASALGAPITVKEIDFLVRQRTPEADIVKEVQQRRLLIPMDAVGEAALKASGASPALIEQIKAPAMVLPTAEAREIARRLVDQEQKNANAARQEAQAANGQSRKMPDTAASRNFLASMQGKLFKWNGSTLVPYPEDLKKVKVFALYTGVGGSAKNRKITLELAEIYRRFQEKHPGEFEVAYMPGDQDDFNLGEYMRRMQVSWPVYRGTPEEQKALTVQQKYFSLRFVEASGKLIKVQNLDTYEKAATEAELEEHLGRLK